MKYISKENSDLKTTIRRMGEGAMKGET